MKIVGNNGQIEVLADRLVIELCGGFIGFFLLGFKGEKTIPFSSISAIQFREPGMVLLGYIQFNVLGLPKARIQQLMRTLSISRRGNSASIS